MKKEIAAAGIFLKNLVKKSHKLNSEQVDIFVKRLMNLLKEKYKGHWYPKNPTRGQAFRCIRINGHHGKDADLLLACQKSGVEYCYLDLPSELTLWVDPGEVSCRYSEDTPPFTVARIIGHDDDDDDDCDGDDYNEKVSTKVKGALEKVTSDYHSETSSDDDCACIAPLPENDGAFTTSSLERAGDWERESQSIFCTGLSTKSNTVIDTPAKRHGGGATTTLPRNRSLSVQVVHKRPQQSLPLSWRIPLRSPVKPQPFFLLNPCVKPFPTVRPHGWSNRNLMWSCPSGRSDRGSTRVIWSFAGNERHFKGKMNFNRPL